MTIQKSQAFIVYIAYICFFCVQHSFLCLIKSFRSRGSVTSLSPMYNNHQHANSLSYNHFSQTTTNDINTQHIHPNINHQGTLCTSQVVSIDTHHINNYSSIIAWCTVLHDIHTSRLSLNLGIAYLCFELYLCDNNLCRRLLLITLIV